MCFRQYNIFAIIPARGGSKGIPGKNIKHFCGKPLIFYSIQLANQCLDGGLINGYVVSTDDDDISKVAQSFGSSVIKRPTDMATDHSPVAYAVIHAISNTNLNINHVLLLQPTNPLTELADVKGSIRTYVEYIYNGNLISICDAQHVRLSTLYYKKKKKLISAVSSDNPTMARQLCPCLYWRNGAVYIIRKDILFKEKTLVIKNPLYYEMPRERSVAIDDLFDWQLAEYLYERKSNAE